MGQPVPLYQIDPLQDPRWSAFLERHPRACVYGSPEWLDALRRTYGYDAFVLTTAPPGTPLTNGLPVCRVKSWLTGSRLVSLPFSDHCPMLVQEPNEAVEMLSFLATEVSRNKWRYAEVRPTKEIFLGQAPSLGFQASQTFWAHQLDLSPSLEKLFAQFHKSCVQRKVRRAEREGLLYEKGSTGLLVAKFYHLLRLTRKRHGLPAQPEAWFRNLLVCLGNKVTIHIASTQGKPIAGLLTLAFKKTLVYKYGGSDARYHNLGSMPFLFWQAIQHAKQMEMEEFDLGRSDAEATGLIDFKGHLGATGFPLTYYRFPASRAAHAANGWKREMARRVSGLLPVPLLGFAGRLLYRHFG